MVLSALHFHKKPDWPFREVQFSSINIPHILRFRTEFLVPSLHVRDSPDGSHEWVEDLKEQQSMREVTLGEMLKRGVHFGHRESRWHPKMRTYIHTVRQGIHILDLEKTLECLRSAYDFLKQQASEGKVILFVGTKRQAQQLIREAAQRAGTPFIADRWIGGTLTNFITISKLIRKLKQLRSSRERGELQKYTKKEQLGFDQEIDRLGHLIGGIESLEKSPDVVFVADIKQDSLAIEEARKLRITRVAIVDSNANPDLVDYPIPANDDAVSSLELIISLMADAVEEGKKLHKQKSADATAAAASDGATSDMGPATGAKGVETVTV